MKTKNAADVSGSPGRAPIVVFIAVLAVLPLFLLATLTQPIGPMYWDHYIYLDAANRIFNGQIPSIDFFAPVGALGYYLFTALLWLFPNGHPLLLSSWAILLVAAPLMAVVVLDVQKRSSAQAFALLAPFLFFTILPFTTGEFYPFPGSEGFGIYNRQVCQLLYVLAAGLVFMREGRRLAILTALTMLALLFIKITGVAAGVILCLLAFVTGRLPLRNALIAGATFFAVLAVLELSTGMVTAYTNDIISLLSVNDESLLPRLFQAASLNFGLLAAAGLLCATLFVSGLRDVRFCITAFVRNPGIDTIQRTLDQPFIWLGGFVLAGLVFESQNTGSQAFIFLWPLLLKTLIDTSTKHGHSAFSVGIAVLVMATALPPAVLVVQKSARAWIGAVQHIEPSYTHLKTMGAVSVRPLQALRAERMRASYIKDQATYSALAAAGELPSFLLFSDFDFQSLWLVNADEAVVAVKVLETTSKVRIDTVMSIDFTNPFAWLLDKRAPKYIAIGADPFRAVPALQEDVIAAVKAVDIALLPTCPSTTANVALLNLYEPMLVSNHTRIALTPCYDAFVRNDLPKSE